MMHFKDFFESVWYNGQEYRKSGRDFPDLDKLFHDIAAKEGVDKVLVSNSVVNKIGINPMTTNRTPVGQYFYPLNYVLKTGLKSLPWGRGRPYIIITKIKEGANIINIVPFSYPQVNNPTTEIESVDFPYKKELITRAGGMEAFKALFKEYFFEKRWTVRSNFSIPWIIVFAISSQEKPYKRAEPLHGYETGNNFRSHLSERMTGIFRSLGIDGFLDHGTGTIHPNEPNQCLIINTGVLQSVLTIDLSKPEK